MIVTPKTSSSIAQLPTAKSDTNVGLSARERAIQAFMKTSSAEQPAAQHNMAAETNNSIKTTNTDTNTPDKSPKIDTIANSPIEAASQKDSIESNNLTTASVEDSSAESKVSPEPLSSQYAILARKDKALRQREQALKAREEALKAKEAPVSEASKAPLFDESKYISIEELQRDPFGILTNRANLSYDQLTQAALNAPSSEQLALEKQIRSLESKIERLTGETENTKKSFEQSQQQQNDQALNLMKQETRKLIASDESFEMLKITPGAINQVVKLIEDTYYKDGEFLSVEDAALLVEEGLAERAIKYATSKKIQQRLQPKSASVEKPVNGQPPQQPQLKTLTNAVSGSRSLSARERAILAFEGKLGK